VFALLGRASFEGNVCSKFAGSSLSLFFRKSLITSFFFSFYLRIRRLRFDLAGLLQFPLDPRVVVISVRCRQPLSLPRALFLVALTSARECFKNSLDTSSFPPEEFLLNFTVFRGSLLVESLPFLPQPLFFGLRCFLPLFLTV